jgi:hypothetical protein
LREGKAVRSEKGEVLGSEIHYVQLNEIGQGL